MSGTRNAKERDDLIHLLRQVHRTENRKVTEEGVMTEVQKPHRVLATLVVVGEPSTCQDSHLTGKRGASQESPLRVAPRVPSGSRWGPRVLHKALMRSTNIRPGHSCSRTPHHPVRLHDLGPRRKLLREWTQPLHCVLWGWWSPQNHHTDHRAAGCVCRDSWSSGLSWTSDACERASSRGVVSTWLSQSMMINAKNTIIKGVSESICGQRNFVPAFAYGHWRSLAFERSPICVVTDGIRSP